MADSWLNLSVAASSVRYLSWYLLMLLLVMFSCTLLLNWPAIAETSWPVMLTLVLQVSLTIFSFMLLIKAGAVNNAAYLAIMSVSVFLITAFLYLTGGHTNPLISILLISLAICATALSWQPTAIVAVLVLVCYSFLTQFYKPLTLAPHSHHFMQLHLLGMWGTFGISVALIIGLVLPMALALRSQQRLLSQQREKMLRDETLVSIATFATGSAHKLGTPLSTLSVLVEDMLELQLSSERRQQDLKLMAQQIDVCKSILRNMMTKADDIRASKPIKVKVGELLRDLKEQFNLLHPARSLKYTLADPAAVINADATLIQALLNIIDNAVKHADSDPEINVMSEGDFVVFRIEDTGPGVPNELLDQMGQPFVESTKEGFGLGLFLSHSTIERLNGVLKIAQHKHGTVIEIQLPLSRDSTSD